MEINNEKIMNELYQFWTFRNYEEIITTTNKTDTINSHQIIKYIIKIFWPNLYSKLDELSLSMDSNGMLKENILHPIIFENSHLSIGVSTSKYICPNCNKNVDMKIINEYQFNKD